MLSRHSTKYKTNKRSVLKMRSTRRSTKLNVTFKKDEIAINEQLSW